MATFCESVTGRTALRVSTFASVKPFISAKVDTRIAARPDGSLRFAGSEIRRARHAITGGVLSVCGQTPFDAIGNDHFIPGFAIRARTFVRGTSPTREAVGNRARTSAG